LNAVICHHYFAFGTSLHQFVHGHIVAHASSVAQKRLQKPRFSFLCVRDVGNVSLSVATAPSITKEIFMKTPGPTANATSLPSASPSQPNQLTNAAPTVQFDVSNLQSSYANVCNVSSTREEVALAFGVNNVWERGQANIQVQLTNRIVLNPYAAKRFAAVLTRVVAEYESKFGTLKDDARPQANAA
jgi:hypothetical protein